MDIILRAHNAFFFCHYLLVRLTSTIYQSFLCLSPAISLGKGSKFKGMPIIHVVEGSKLVIGRNVSMNSYNRLYHLNLFGPVKFLMDKPGARITIGDNCRIVGGCLHAWSSITVGNNCLIAGNTQIMDSNAHKTSMLDPDNRINTKDEPRPIVIEDNVWVGANCFILKGVRIGKGSVVGAGSVVSEDVPPNSIVLGNPARVIKSTAS